MTLPKGWFGLLYSLNALNLKYVVVENCIEKYTSWTKSVITKTILRWLNEDTSNAGYCKRSASHIKLCRPLFGTPQLSTLINLNSEKDFWKPKRFVCKLFCFLDNWLIDKCRSCCYSGYEYYHLVKLLKLK